MAQIPQRERGDNTARLYVKQCRIDSAGFIGYYHVAVVIQRLHDINNQTSRVLMDFDPVGDSTIWQRLFSSIFPIRGRLNFKIFQDDDYLREAGYRLLQTYDLHHHFWPWLNGNPENDLTHVKRKYEQYDVLRNNCKDFAIEVLRNAVNNNNAVLPPIPYLSVLNGEFLYWNNEENLHP